MHKYFYVLIFIFFLKKNGETQYNYNFFGKEIYFFLKNMLSIHSRGYRLGTSIIFI